MLDKNDPRITAYALDELSGAEHDEVAAAVKESAELQAFVDEIQATAQLMQGCFLSEPSHELTDEQKSTIEQELDATRAMPQRHSNAPIWIGGIVVAAAASILLVLAWQAPINNTNNEVAKFEASASSSKRADRKVGDMKKAAERALSASEFAADEAADMMNSMTATAPQESPTPDPRQISSGGAMGGGAMGGTEGGGMAGMPGMGDGGMGGMPAGGPGAGSGGAAFGGEMGGLPDSDDGSMMSGMMGGGRRANRPGRVRTIPMSETRPRDAAAGGDSSVDEVEESSIPFPDVQSPRSNASRTKSRPAIVPATSNSDGQSAGNGQSGEGQNGKGEAAQGRNSNSQQGQESSEEGRADEREREKSGQQGSSQQGSGGEPASEDDRKTDEGKSGGERSDSKNSGGQSGKQSGKKKGADGEKKKPRGTWKRAASEPNNSRLMIGNNDELPLKGVQMNVQVDGFRALVLLDCYYYNDRNRQLEGSFKLRLPNEASLYYVAFGQTSFEYRPMVDQLTGRGFLSPEILRATGTGPKDILKARQGTWANVKEARMVPKEKAALAYTETVRRRVDPALVEWQGAGVFQARVFPLMPKKLHRIVIGYDVNLRQEGNELKYELPLPSNAPEVTVDLNLAAIPGVNVNVTPQVAPFTASGRAFFHFQNPDTNAIKVSLEGANHSVVVGKDAEKDTFFATRITPELPAGEQLAGSKRAIFLVDTSLSSQPAKFNMWLKMLETILEKNRGPLEEFAVLFFDVQSNWYKPGYTKNTTENVSELIQYCQSLSLEGATDLQQALKRAVHPDWAKVEEGKKTTDGIRPDIFLLSDGAVTWGEDQLYLIGKTLEEGTGGTLFAYKTGYTGTAIGTLGHLARESGGAVFTAINEQSVAKVATAHRSRPWQLMDISVAGGSDLLLGGRVRNIYPGEALHLVGRGEPSGEIVMQLRRGDEKKEVRLPVTQIVRSDLAARAFGQVAVGQLESISLGVEDVAAAYARHFRVTGVTCSLLMLESEADYRRFNIKPEKDNLVVATTSAEEIMTTKLDELHNLLTDPKENVLAWLDKLERSQSIRLNLPTALKVVMKTLPKSSFEVSIPQLESRAVRKTDLPETFIGQLSEKPNDPGYELVTREAERRQQVFGSADGLRTLSSLVEANPGDHVIARDVAFSAIEWDLGGQAYPLLKRVAKARPFEPQTYQAMAQCLASLGNADLALLYYEVVLNGAWNQRYRDIHRICAVEYADLLRQIEAGEMKSALKRYAKARLKDVEARAGIKNSDLVVMMMWNTDRTDVDLHVQEPSGEECYYKNRNTRAGGKITRDVTEGYGPEMYIRDKATSGQYIVKAKYYGQDANRTRARTKVYVTVYENFGKKNQRTSKHTVMLSRGKEKRNIVTVKVGSEKE